MLPKVSPCFHPEQGHSWNWRAGLLNPFIDNFLHRGAVVRFFLLEDYVCSMISMLQFYVQYVYEEFCFTLTC